MSKLERAVYYIDGLALVMDTGDALIEVSKDLNIDEFELEQAFIKHIIKMEAK